VPSTRGKSVVLGSPLFQEEFFDNARFISILLIYAGWGRV